MPPLHLQPHDLAWSGQADRFTKNIEALRLLRDLRGTDRAATFTEQRALAHFTAFGNIEQLNKLFVANTTTKRYEVHPTYRDIVTEEQAKALKHAALTAFYTPLPVIHALWQAVEQLGIDVLEQPQILEPACGVGHFIAGMPPALRERSRITAIELDPVSAAIARHLHPDVTLHEGVGFENVPLLPTFDLVISNVPFGDMQVIDPSTPEEFLRRTIHDYFFARSVRLVRPGGLVVLLTSWGTMDKRSQAVRTWLHEQCVLLGAYRLPNGIFQGSGSASDLLVLQKRPSVVEVDLAWRDLGIAHYPRSDARNHRGLTSGSCYGHTPKGAPSGYLDTLDLHVNEYWLAQPTHIVGTPVRVPHNDRLFLQVEPLKEQELGDALQTVLLATLPNSVLAPPAPCVAEQTSKIAATFQHDTVDLQHVPPQHGGRAQALTEVYDAAKLLLHAEINGADDTTLAQMRQTLNNVYDDFRVQYGIIHTHANQAIFKHAPELAFLLALEINPQRAGGVWRVQKAPIFSTRTLRAQADVVAGEMDPHDALLHCLEQRGAVDIPLIAALSGLPQDDVPTVLHDAIIRDPGTTQFVTLDAYLSGNIRQKLQEAQLWAAEDGSYKRHVVALEGVLPPELGPSDIAVRLNSYWLLPSVLEAFVQHVLPAFRGRCRYNDKMGQWEITDPHNAAQQSVEAQSQWGTPRANAMTILESSMRGVPVAVYDTWMQDGKQRRKYNAPASVAAGEKQDALKAAFEQWIWADEQRSAQLCRVYNERFNSIRLREYNGQHLRFPGMNKGVLKNNDLHDYQKDGVWQVILSRGTLVNFGTGAGKTYTAIAAAMEAKRLGLVYKPVVAVPKGLVGQWAAAVRRLYPAARVLALSPDDFTKQRRPIALSRIAMAPWDLVIIGHTSLQKLPLDETLLQEYYDYETDRVRSYLEELRMMATDDDEKLSLKQIERSVKQFEARLDRMLQVAKRDSERTITWKQLGVDGLFVDEAHNHKNMWCPTKLVRIAGLPTATAQRAIDLRIRSWDILRQGGKVVLLTATPVMNTLAEVYVMQLLVQEGVLQAAGINHFDEWVSLFAEACSSWEMTPDGGGFRSTTALRRFTNVPELMAMWKQNMIVRTKAQLKQQLGEPEWVDNKRIVITVPASIALKRYVQWLSERADAIRLGRIDPEDDNMLAITGEGRRIALDPRLVVPGAVRPRHSKIVYLAEVASHLYHQYARRRATQIIFCDLGTPKGRRDTATPKPAAATPPADTSVACDEADEQGDDTNERSVETAAEVRQRNFVYHEIKAELVARGIAPHEVAFIHDWDTPRQRMELFANIRNGHIRFLLGSRQKLSEGVDIQDRLLAVHHLDCPWRPGDLEQSDGRVQRQGNMWPQVYTFAYVTEGSFDGYMWQKIETKDGFIKQLFTQSAVRSAEDISDTQLSAAEVKAAASGNPAIVQKVKCESELGRLERVRANWLATVGSLQHKRGWTLADIEHYTSKIGLLTDTIAHATNHTLSSFEAHVADGVTTETTTWYAKRDDAGTALSDLADELLRRAKAVGRERTARAATYRGFEVRLTAQPPSRTVADASVQAAFYLPDGRYVSALNAGKFVHLWQSVDAVLRHLPQEQAQYEHRRASKEQEVVAIDRELARLSTWDKQAAYDALAAELRVLNAELLLVEHNTSDEHDGAATNGTSTGATPPKHLVSNSIGQRRAVWREIQALLQAEQEGAALPLVVVVPPAPRSLALLEIPETREEQEPTPPAPAMELLDLGQVWELPPAREHEVVAQSATATTTSRSTAQFGRPLPQFKAKPAKAAGDDAARQAPDADQLSLF